MSKGSILIVEDYKEISQALKRGKFSKQYLHDKEERNKKALQ